MADHDHSAPRLPRSGGRGFPVGIAALAAVATVNAAAWFYFRSRQPVTDELTRDRLQPRGQA